MYVDIDCCGCVSLMQMNMEEAEALATMIRGASPSERCKFGNVLRQLEEEAGV